MPDQYMLVLTPLLSAAMGGVVALTSVYFTNRSNTKRLQLQLDREERRRNAETRRERGEELYMLTEAWLTGLAANYLTLLSVMRGNLTYNQHLDIVIEDGKARSVNFARIALLIDIYFPTTRKAYDQVLSARASLNKIAGAHKHAYKQGDIDGERFVGPFVQAQKAVEASGEVYKQQILESIRAI
jgi:hypothetical protein